MFFCSWLPFIDPESGNSQYQLCVSTTPENCTVTTFTDVGINTSFSVHGLQLVHGELYYAVIKGTNRIGLSSETTTKGILIDSTPPTIKDADNLSINKTKVTPTTESNSNTSVPREIEMPANEIQESSHIRFRCSEELLTSNWDEFEDSESELERYDWCVGTSEARCNVFFFFFFFFFIYFFFFLFFYFFFFLFNYILLELVFTRNSNSKLYKVHMNNSVLQDILKYIHKLQ